MTRKILWTINIVIILTLVWLNVVPHGRLHIDYDVGKKNAHVTDFRPGEKLIPFQQEPGVTFHTLTDSPVYFHVRTPRPFQQAEISIEYRAKEKTNLVFGDQTGPELYEFVYENIETIPDGKWHTANVSIDLGRMYYHKDTKRYQFSFITDENIDVAALTITFEKPPITIARALDYFRNSN